MAAYAARSSVSGTLDANKPRLYVPFARSCCSLNSFSRFSQSRPFLSRKHVVEPRVFEPIAFKSHKSIVIGVIGIDGNAEFKRH